MSTEQSLPYFDGNNNMQIPSGTRLRAVTSLDQKGYKDSFSFQFAYADTLLARIKTVTAHRVYQKLFYLLAQVDNRNGSVVAVTQAELARLVKCAQPEISKAIKELSTIGIVLSHSRGFIKLNPKCAWNGNLKSWQEECEAIAEQQSEQPCP